MAAINWDSHGTRVYESGLDRVVIYPNNGAGVPWFGVQSIESAPIGGDIESYHMDGVTYLLVPQLEEYSATISSVNYPVEFEPCIGLNTLAKGLTVSQQHRVPFSIVYRTLLGSDISPLGTHYKIHVVYNAVTKPSGRTHASLRNDPSMERFSWSIVTKPIVYPGVKPIASMSIDSRDVQTGRLELLESYLYGGANKDPQILMPGQIIAILEGEAVSF